jgi:glycosyltransferase involved in cell wall biosynthesis
VSTTLDSASWAGAPPSASVVISTHRRAQFLPELLGALERQTLGVDRFEVVVVDDGSADGPGGTWDALTRLAASTPLRLRAVLRPASGGPAVGRNEGSSHARGDVLAFTDDDCLPQPGWLGALVDAVAGGADVVQGRTEPEPARPPDAGPWARTITVTGPTALFETCNLAYRRRRFEELGGFDEHDPLTAPGAGRHFGEDAVLGARLVGAGGRSAYRDDAVVHHRWLPTSFGDHLRHQRRLAGFPGLATRSPVLAAALWRGAFLSPATAAFDLAVAGVVLSAVTGRRRTLLLVVPWVAQRWPQARAKRQGRPTVVRLAQLAATDLVGFASLLEGSFRHRRLVL